MGERPRSAGRVFSPCRLLLGGRQPAPGGTLMNRDFVLRKRNQSGVRDERGAAAVEFGLVALKTWSRELVPVGGSEDARDPRHSPKGKPDDREAAPDDPDVPRRPEGR